MGKGVYSASTNKSWGEGAYNCFKRIVDAQKEGKSTFVCTGVSGREYDYEIKPDEKFVVLFDYDRAGRSRADATNVEGMLEKRYRVSSKGNVFSIRKRKGSPGPGDSKDYEVYKMKQGNKTEKGYQSGGFNWQPNRLVWFSFAADAIRDPEKREYDGTIPAMYGIPKEERTIQNLKDLKELMKYEVDHEDKNPKNNSLDNLRLMPKEENLRLVRIDRAKTDEKVLKELSAIEEDAVVMPGRDGKRHTAFNIHEKERTEELENTIKDLEDAYVFNLLYEAFSYAYITNPEKLKKEIYGEMKIAERTVLFKVLKKSKDLVIKELKEIPEGKRVTVRYDISKPKDIVIIE